MRRPRFTIGNLLVFVLFLALGFAALRAATEAWDSGVLGVTLALLLASVLLAIHRTGPARAHWLGFALFGWAYVLLGLIPSVEARLPTAKGLAYLDSLVPGRAVSSWSFINVNPSPLVVANPAGPGGGNLQVSTVNVTGSPTTGQTIRWTARANGTIAALPGSTESFIRIGHSLLALTLACVGASLSRSLHTKKERGRVSIPGPIAVTREDSADSPTS
jgi:hypothetical protein